jgi:hypothetical protein
MKGELQSTMQKPYADDDCNKSMGHDSKKLVSKQFRNGVVKIQKFVMMKFIPRAKVAVACLGKVSGVDIGKKGS